MPILKPEVQEILRQAGLAREAAGEDESSLIEHLDSAGLDKATIAEELTHLARNSSNEGLRLRALETALKVRGALKDQSAPIPTFNLIIQPASASSNPPSVNPIIFPRQSLNFVLGLEKPPDKKEN